MKAIKYILITGAICLLSVQMFSQNEFRAGDPSTISTSLTPTQINAGDSVIIYPGGNGQVDFGSITIYKGAGTNYTAAGSDTISYVKCNCGGVRIIKGFISGKWMLDNLMTGAQIPIQGCIDPGSPLWIDFPPDLATGTRSLNIKGSYIKY